MENAGGLFSVVRECGFLTFCFSGWASFSLEDIKIERIKKGVTKLQSVLILNMVFPPNNLSLSVSRDAVVRLLIEKGVFTKEDFLEMVNVVNLEIARMANK